MNQTKFTHGLGLKTTSPSDCVARSIEIGYSESEDRYYISINTQWTANTQPTITNLSIQPAGMTLLFDALQRILLNREMYRMKELE